MIIILNDSDGTYVEMGVKDYNKLLDMINNLHNILDVYCPNHAAVEEANKLLRDVPECS